MIRHLEWERPVAVSRGDDVASASAPRTTRRLTGLMTCAVAAVYSAGLALHGWIPHDEGLLSHTAERVLKGELPHRDFDDCYTGGLALLHAAAFQVLGMNLASLRWVLLGFSTLFVAALYSMLARAMRPREAALVTLTAAAWGAPNYFAALPSWYNLFFAGFSILAVLRYIDTNRSRWLFAAGLAAGVSILFKIVGAYYVGAVALFLVYREQCRAEAENAPPSRRLVLPTLLGAVAVTTMLLLVVRRAADAMVIANFVLPGAVVALFLVVNEARVGRGNSLARVGRLLGALSLFAAGVLAPIGAFALPYAWSDSLPALWHGVFVLPQRRLDNAAMELPSPVALLFPCVAFLLAVVLNPRRLRAWHVAAFIVFGGTALLYTRLGPTYHAFWSAARFSMPIIAASAVWILTRAEAEGGPSSKRRQQLFLIVAAASFCSLVQFPFSSPIYYCYVAPLAVVAAALVAVNWPGGPLQMRNYWSVAFLAFAVFALHKADVYKLGFHYAPSSATTKLDLPRGGLFVSPTDAAGYKLLVDEIRRQTPDGSYIYAAPDCTHVYFLSERQNPTRTMFDFFDDPTDRSSRIIRAWDEYGIGMALINNALTFSAPVDPVLETELHSRLPQTRRIGPFTVYSGE